MTEPRGAEAAPCGQGSIGWRAGAVAAAFANQRRKLQLAARFPRFAGAMALRRLYSALCVAHPLGARAVAARTPVELVLRVNSVCQLSCRMCGIHEVMQSPQYRGARLTHADLAPAFRELAAWRPRPYVKFTGGEPLLLGDELFRMLADCRDLGLPTRLSTNGIVLANPEAAMALARTGVDAVTISLDGPREVHNALRGRDYAFDRAVAGVRNLAEARAVLGQAAPLIQIGSVLLAANASSLRDLYRLCLDLPIDWLNVQLLNFVAPTAAAAADQAARERGYEPGPWRAFIREELRPVDAEALAESIAWIRRQPAPFVVSFQGADRFSAERLRAYYAEGDAPLGRTRCALPFMSMGIAPTGDLMFCVDYPYVTYGNVRGRSLRAGWRSAEARRFRADLLAAAREGRGPLPQCNRCNWLYY